MSPKLSLPQIDYQHSFLEAVSEYQAEYLRNGNLRLGHYAKLNAADLERDFSGFVAKLRAQSGGEGLSVDYVPNSVYWLVDDDKFIGWVDIRHSLTPKLLQTGGHIGYDIRPSERGKGLGKLILQLALVKAKKLGIAKALVTCSVTNIGSKKVIEANGGKYENTVSGEPGQPPKLRYWITV